MTPTWGYALATSNRQSMPQPRRKSTLSDDLTAAVRELIRNEGLSPGDRLPAVQTLAQMLEVATPTMREALRRLQAAGVVTIRHGSGTYVGAQADRHILPNPHMPEVDARTLTELLETRRLVEPTAAQLAAIRAGSGALEPARFLEEAEQQLDDELRLTLANMQFHVAVARLSGNKILAETIDALLSTYSNEQHEILVLFDDRKKDFDDHRRILEAIVRGDAEAANHEMRDHLTCVIEIVARRLGRS